MSLHIYDRKEDIPNGVTYIKSNDAFFNAHNMLLDNEFTRSVLKNIDKAEYINNRVFLGRVKTDGNLNKRNLSTGSKTLLNIAGCKDKCFDVVECGQNALDFIWGISDGHIFWKNIVAVPDGDDESCDIVYRGKHFHNRFDFLDYAMEVCNK